MVDVTPEPPQVQGIADQDHEVPVGVVETLQEQVPPEAILSVAQATGTTALDGRD